ncbi:fusarubin cluster-esterase protein [Rutstroemia sp. NJR-2017a WRK4]|nr:fusarubin cluster-esterase protein [Rutstroemia sp. NJR-2017a WRK4]PQE11788.1 fusarubin cluster-esterase protein [Rutstroemia sp. NJR-2017a WRK4]
MYCTYLFLLVCSLVRLAASSVPVYTPHSEAYAARSYFYVGGQYITVSPNNTIYTDQMYVEHIVPSRILQPYPLVFIHGQGQTGTNWLNKPDGGPGWATYFLSHGYEVYIIDQTARGRSPWNPNGNTTLTIYPVQRIEQRFTGTQNFNIWPQASLHTQWPGTGLQGDPIFDAYYASTVQFQSDTVIQENNMQIAGAALLNRTGPAILLSHSQGGLVPWVIADAAPGKVVAIVSVEPTGPPFQDTVFPPTTPGGYTRPWGITDIRITYEPALGANETLQWESVANNGTKDELANCLLQKEPARRLPNLEGIPVLVETAEASFHAVYDGCTVAFLKQAGVDVEWMPLATKGIHGNGHMQFLEKNSDEIANVLDEWIRSKVRGKDKEN